MSKEYQRMNVKKLLETRKHTIISLEDALKDIVPIDWSEDVLSGKTKVVVYSPANDEEVSDSINKFNFKYKELMQMLTQEYLNSENKE